MLSFLLLMSLILSVSIGNLALGFGLAVHMGQGPAKGWQALCFWKKDASADPHAAPTDPHAPHAEPAAHAPAPAAHGHH
ncbi:hypothetical protein [Anatilimnocola floriformis]|uniref:hypothetical protein n=1 Tax=Anatilimnocola floriformis TaxID=2948575 RepID=UPI0020C3EECF|nr:hypothetical protein [Anatilimnocola floriformis]